MKDSPGEQINFQREFSRIARMNGAGGAIDSSLTCHKARKVLETLFVDGGATVESFKDGVLTIEFESSSALAHFDMIRLTFEENLQDELKKVSSKIVFRGVKATIA